MSENDLLNDLDPAFRSLDAAHLDAGEGLVELLGDGAHFRHAAGEADLFAVVHDLADGGDDGCGAAEAAFREIGDLVKVDLSLLGFQAKIFLGNIDEGAAGRMLPDLGVTTLLSLVTNRKLAPPVSSTLVRVAGSKYMFSSKPCLWASTMA